MTTRKNRNNKDSTVHKTPQPINLRQRYGDKYQIAHDPAYAAEHGPAGKIDDPWLQIIPGRCGHIFPWGGEMLAVSTNSRGPTANRLLKMPCCKVMQDGDDGVTLVFHAGDLRKVAHAIHARTTRRLTDAQRAKLVAAGRHSRFGGNSATSRRLTTPEITPPEPSTAVPRPADSSGGNHDSDSPAPGDENCAGGRLGDSAA